MKPWKNTAAILREHGYHKFKAGVKPAGASKASHYPCEVCGLTRKFRGHHVPSAESPEPSQVSDPNSVIVKCPTCDGTGTFHLAMKDVIRLAVRKAAGGSS